jgi:hypothetical protein
MKSAVLLLVFLSLRLVITLVQREARKSTTVMRKLQMVIIPFSIHDYYRKLQMVIIPFPNP